MGKFDILIIDIIDSINRMYILLRQTISQTIKLFKIKLVSPITKKNIKILLFIAIFLISL